MGNARGGAERDMAEGSSAHVSGDIIVNIYWQNRIRPISHIKNKNKIQLME